MDYVHISVMNSHQWSLAKQGGFKRLKWLPESAKKAEAKNDEQLSHFYVSIIT